MVLEDSTLLKNIDRGEQAKYLRAAFLARSIHCMSPHVTCHKKSLPLNKWEINGIVGLPTLHHRNRCEVRWDKS
jgi:hypothetical protein